MDLHLFTGLVVSLSVVEVIVEIIGLYVHSDPPHFQHLVTLFLLLCQSGNFGQSALNLTLFNAADKNGGCSCQG